MRSKLINQFSELLGHIMSFYLICVSRVWLSASLNIVSQPLIVSLTSGLHGTLNSAAERRTQPVQNTGPIRELFLSLYVRTWYQQTSIHVWQCSYVYSFILFEEKEAIGESQRQQHASLTYYWAREKICPRARNCSQRNCPSMQPTIIPKFM